MIIKKKAKKKKISFYWFTKFLYFYFVTSILVASILMIAILSSIAIIVTQMCNICPSIVVDVNGVLNILIIIVCGSTIVSATIIISHSLSYLLQLFATHLTCQLQAHGLLYHMFRLNLTSIKWNHLMLQLILLLSQTRLH